MIHHDMTYTEKSEWTGNKIQHHYVDYDLTNTANRVRRELKKRKSSTNVSAVLVRLKYMNLPRVRIDNDDILALMMCQGFITVVI